MIRRRGDRRVRAFPTTGGGQNLTVQDRLDAPRAFDPEMCSLNMGSMNFGLFPTLARYQTFTHDWEQPYLEASRDYIFRNTFADIEYILQALGARTSGLEGRGRGRLLTTLASPGEAHGFNRPGEE